ncbi:MAG: hypothetical protein ACREKA_06890 [Candidatus Methylomirabilales bacterium]
MYQYLSKDEILRRLTSMEDREYKYIFERERDLIVESPEDLKRRAIKLADDDTYAHWDEFWDAVLHG